MVAAFSESRCRRKAVFQQYSICVYVCVCECVWRMYVCMYVLSLRKGSLMKTQTRLLDDRLYYTRKIELDRKGKKSRTVRKTPILNCPLAAKSLVLITVRRVHYGEMGNAPTTVCMCWGYVSAHKYACMCVYMCVYMRACVYLYMHVYDWFRH